MKSMNNRKILSSFRTFITKGCRVAVAEPLEIFIHSYESSEGLYFELKPVKYFQRNFSEFVREEL